MSSFEYCPNCQELALSIVSSSYSECYNCKETFDLGDRKLSEYDDHHHDDEHHDHHNERRNSEVYGKNQDFKQTKGFLSSLKAFFYGEDNVATEAEDESILSENTSYCRAYDVFIKKGYSCYMEGVVLADSPHNIIQIVADHFQTIEVKLLSHKEIDNTFDEKDNKVVFMNQYTGPGS